MTNPLEDYTIPLDIIDLENGDISKLDSIIEKFANARISPSAYIQKFTALIHMEEAANTKHLETFKLKNVQIASHSNTCSRQIYKFSHGDYQKYYRAWKNKTIETFTAKPNGTELDLVVSGQIQQVDTHYILLKVLEGAATLVAWSGGFNITFNINRKVYQLQHNALKWIKEHNLFSILIDNPQYELTWPQKPETECRYLIFHKTSFQTNLCISIIITNIFQVCNSVTN